MSAENPADKYVLEIEWDEGGDLPSLVGPFDTRDEALRWFESNVPNGTGEARPLAVHIVDCPSWRTSR